MMETKSSTSNNSGPSYTQHARQYVDLHDQVKASTGLLDTLENFLSTFQTDLAAVSGQISNLQDRSKDIENRLKSRKKIEKPLSNLLSDLCIPPTLATTILDTEVDEAWLTAIPDFQQKLTTINARKRVKAARDLAELVEGLRIVAATKIRAFFIALIQPLRTSMTANMQVLQTSVLVKYRLLYEFLQEHANDVAKEVQHFYVAAARVYYETGFRRYIRSLGWLRDRSIDKFEPIGSLDPQIMFVVDETRLANAKIDGPAVVQAFVAENKAHKEPTEALFRSMLLVLMDNATAEYTFISVFFAPKRTNVATAVDTPAPSPRKLQYVDDDGARRQSLGTETVGSPPMRRRKSLAQSISHGLRNPEATGDLTKEDLAIIGQIWKQIMEPSLNYCQTFAISVLEPSPPVIPLLTMIRIMENTLAEVQIRGCVTLEAWLFGLRMQFWPVFQKLMSEHVSSLNKLAEAGSGGLFRRASSLSDEVVRGIANRYIAIFSSFVAITETDDETMIFSNLNRLRHELTALIVTQSKRLADPLKSISFQSTLYETLLQAISKNQLFMAHPKAQSELGYWREREEESRRRIANAAASR